MMGWADSGGFFFLKTLLLAIYLGMPFLFYHQPRMERVKSEHFFELFPQVALKLLGLGFGQKRFLLNTSIQSIL